MPIKTITKDNNFFVFRFLNIKDINIEYLHLLGQLSKVDYTSLTHEKNIEFIKKLDENHIIIVIECNKKIIGSGTILIESKLIRNYGKVAHIEDIVIHEDYRMCGLGCELIKELVNIAKNKKCYKCILNCENRLRSFYEKCHFKNTGIEMANYFK